MQASENADLLNRFLSQSSAIDCRRLSIVFMNYLVGRNVLQAIPVASSRTGTRHPALHEGQISGRPQGVAAGHDAVHGPVCDRPGRAEIRRRHPTEFLTGIPTVTNADTLGIRPDLVGRPINSWADLLSPEFKGKAALQDQPTIGVIDVAMAIEARGDIKYGNKGNMTKAEIDKTIDTMIEHQEIGPVPLVLDDVRSVGEPDGLGRGGDPVDVVAGRRRRAVARHSLRVPAAEGRLSRLGLHAGADEASDRPEARLLLRIHELVHLRVSGRLHCAPGLLLGAAGKRANS